jgi:uncharacterized membrane protein
MMARKAVVDGSGHRAPASPARGAGNVLPRKQRSTWPVPVGLVLLGIVPIVSGSARIVELWGGPAVLPVNPGYVASPVPVVVHIVSASLYAILGAFQFSAGIRRRHPGWHRAAGRLLVLLGLAVALSALWLNQFHARPESNELLYLFRLVFASAMLASIVVGFTAIRRRDVSRHRAWMTRAYAIALAAGTQAFTLGIGATVFGTGELSTALLSGAAWVLNLTVAEWTIRKNRAPRTHTSRRTAQHS